MNRRPWQVTFTIALLFGASVLLAGCPKKPAPAAGTGPGGAAGPGAAGTAGSGPGGTAGDSGAGGGTGGGMPGTVGTGPGGTMGGGAAGGAAGSAGGPGAAGPGVAGATGTTIPALPSPKEFVETSALRDVHFDFDRYEVRAQDKPVLDENATWLKQNAGALLLIEGHADERGTNEYNLALGERRAKATRDHLVSLGVDGGRITVISYGEERPLCTERTEACWAQNRRSHFLVKQ
ncbi:MAG: peptidoglycan-associated lipoprotein Pal [Candidatus Rokubacteria bacterium]|nr:peptidoglycan-associated lipoprotein Pal [Candidatus Rokubacteria bacterium]